jgi:hypothetical protein
MVVSMALDDKPSVSSNLVIFAYLTNIREKTGYDIGVLATSVQMLLSYRVELNVDLIDTLILITILPRLIALLSKGHRCPEFILNRL